VLGALQLAIEMQIDQPCQPAGFAPVINFNPAHSVGIETQFDFQSAQTQVHLVKAGVDAHGAVFAHCALDAGEKQRLQLQACIDVAQGAGSLCKTLLGKAVVDNIGPASWAHSMASIARGGTIVITGVTTGLEVPLPLLPMLSEQITVCGSIMGTLQDMKDMMNFIVTSGITP
jgi:D-arabinose 1-dehydrogenase-like Zn-dependent alcohol dehydrogenase